MPLDHAQAPRPAARRTAGLRALLRRARRQGTVAVVLSLLAGPLLAVAVAPAASAAITSPFERQFVANINGDVVVVDVDGERSFKVWKRTGARVTLSFANPRFPEYRIPPDALVEVWGVVSSSVCAHRRSA